MLFARATFVLSLFLDPSSGVHGTSTRDVNHSRIPGFQAQSIDQSRWEHKMAAQQRWLQSRGHHSTSAARAHSGASRSHEPVSPSSSSSVSSNHSEYKASRPTRPPQLRNPVRQQPGRRTQPTVKSVIVRLPAATSMLGETGNNNVVAAPQSPVA